MPKGSPTTMFVSSTCYDLSQIRADLRDFALSLGYEPVLSELDSFPVNPSVDTVSNCLGAVKDRADLFVLVVGGRYGSVSESGLSITNLEYLEAVAKGIPIFVFVKHDVITLLPTWKANPTADFRHAVDTPKLFEFVDTLRTKGQVWVFPFSSAQDITSTLRRQLSYLVSECLALRSKLYPTDSAIQSLGPASLRTYIEKPIGWEYLVLAEVMRERVRIHDSKRMDLELGISFGPIVHIRNRAEAIAWILHKIAEIKRIPKQVETALSLGVEPAVGPKGQPGDIHRIVHLATRFADGYLAAIEWALEFRRVDVDNSLARLLELASEFASNMIREMREYAEGLRKRIEAALLNAEKGGAVSFILVLTAPDMSEFEAEIARVATQDDCDF